MHQRFAPFDSFFRLIEWRLLNVIIRERERVVLIVWFLFRVLQHDVDGKTYYQFEFTVQARNYTRHALGTITVFNGIYIPMNSHIHI